MTDGWSTRPLAQRELRRYSLTGSDATTARYAPGHRTTSYSYQDSSNTVVTTSDLTLAGDPYCTTDVQVVSDVVYDGLGRKITAHQERNSSSVFMRGSVKR